LLDARAVRSRNNFYLIIRMSSFPTGRCCAGEKCVAPTHELIQI
jgi:hypothetical protein